jgi:hypothetical protein
MQLWQMDVMGGVLLEDGTELKAITGIDDHSRRTALPAMPRRTKTISSTNLSSEVLRILFRTLRCRVAIWICVEGRDSELPRPRRSGFRLTP